MSVPGGPDREPVAFPVHGLLGALSLFVGLFVILAAAELAGFLIAAPGPVPRNLGLETILSARANAWWKTPFVAIAPILGLPLAMQFEWARSPGGLFAALGRLKPAAAWIGPAVFLVGFIAIAASTGSGLLGFLVLWLSVLIVGGLAVLFLFGWASRAGFSQSAFMLLLAAVGGVASGAMAAAPNATLACKDGAAVMLAGAAEPCAEIFAFTSRQANLIRRPDGEILIAPKASQDLASLRDAVGPRSIWFDEIRPAD